jgi:hypothetical protein
MRRSLLPLALLSGALAASFATAAHAQTTRIEIRRDSRGDPECYRNGRRIDCDELRDDRDRVDRERRQREERLRDERDDREDRSRERAAEARERALERSRELREQALERSRVERERAQERAETARRVAAETRRQQLEWAERLRRDLARERERDRDRDRERARERARELQRRRSLDLRPSVSLGGGADIRRFDDVNRYVVNGGVEFRTRFGLGVRPEVLYGWSDRQTEQLPLVICATCSALPPTVTLRSRSQMLGVNLNATYTMLRSSPVRPYLLGGVGVLSTREVTPVVATTQVVGGSPAAQQVTYTTSSRDRVDLGLNAGAGMEFGRGPVRLFTEFRYFLNDTPSARGFSGMLPITAGLRF